jgi:2-keto-4-pentenoate hydratase/2-oxohepta-3-ene-1,7-dioic acid hydratase in catechol pathway
MKLMFFDDFKLGVVTGESVVDVSAAVAGIPRVHPQDVIRGVIEQWPDYRPALEQAAAAGTGVPLSSVRVRPPLPRPSTIDCMAVNYMENGTLPAPPPINAFQKAPSTVIGDGDVMVLPDVPASIFEGEAELAIIIGRRCANVPAADAMDYIFGYTNFIDGSARGLPPAASFFLMKSRDTFCPIGPFIVTADEVPDPQNLTVRLWNNGQLMQDFDTSDMAHKIPRCIEFASSVHTLEPGDILATGTNHRGLNPFMDGDQVELEVEQLGRLHIRVRDDLKRSWKRETRFDRQQAGLEGPTPQVGGKYADG